MKTVGSGTQIVNSVVYKINYIYNAYTEVQQSITHFKKDFDVVNKVEESVGNDYIVSDDEPSELAENMICVASSGSMENFQFNGSLTYKGFYKFGANSDMWDYPEFKGRLESAPIESHKDFEDFAGTYQEPNETNGAVFNEDGTFSHFKLTEDQNDPARENPTKAGITTYLQTSVEFIETEYVDDRQFDNDDLLKINEDPVTDVDVFDESFENEVEEDQDWLCVSIEGYYVGNQHVLRKTWLRSGLNGWNDEIYDWNSGA